MPPIGWPTRNRPGRSRDCTASAARSMFVVCIEHLDDLASLAESGLLLRLLRPRPAGFECIRDAANESVFRLEQVQVLLWIAQDKIQPRFDRQSQVRAFNVLADIFRHAEGKIR